ncbi:hypothetical protein Pan216_08590 [Planctomycetes bacterium Pan216]|uniref:Uncharacterized protein n=1 Tax=Kolteria novifilia TaxID=2527975 RepID=A0A518AZ86_9BACT|nr:hypothetical protein Pan216_08590 [Planctomycetes bacterium Pan216]
MDPFDFDDLPGSGDNKNEPSPPLPSSDDSPRKRRWLEPVIIVGGLLLIVLAIVVWQSFSTRTVRANSFILLDDSGTVRATLSMEDENPSLTFFDPEGRQRSRLALRFDGPHLLLYDENQTPRAILGLTDEGAGMNFLDSQGRLLHSFPR